MQITDTVLMVRPAAFSFNAETAANNFFQNKTDHPAEYLQQKALEQFDAMVELLRSNRINVVVIEDSAEPKKPNAIFPNNWFTAGHDGGIHLFPMFAPSRRLEKRPEVVEQIQSGFSCAYVKDWSHLEEKAQYLEGTGSMVMDHNARIIYACTSGRTSMEALEAFAGAVGYRVMAFAAEDDKGPIYHTNVMMSIGETFAVLCPKVITDHMERIAVAQLLEATGHENIYIEPEHMKQFAGNLLQVKNTEGASFIVISKTAYDALPEEKLQRLAQHGTLLPVDVSLIEEVEGGSVRCMMAEIFLQKK